MLVAALIVEFLKRKNPLSIPFDKSAFMAVAPNVAKVREKVKERPRGRKIERKEERNRERTEG
jgi:hypothetical protein